MIGRPPVIIRRADKEKSAMTMNTIAKRRGREMKAMRVAGVVALGFAGAAAQGAILNALADAEWHVDAGWQGGRVPAADDSAIVNYDRTLTHSSGQHAIKTLRIASIGSSAQGGHFRMTGGELSVDFDFSLGYAGSGGTGTALLSGGTLTAGNVNVGSSDADVAGVLNISGGTLNWSQGLRVGTLASGTLTVGGTNATITGRNVFLNEHSTLQFDLGTDSVSALAAYGNLTIHSAAKLVIDGSNYTGGAAVIDLVKFRARSGAFDAGRVTIRNFKGLSGSIEYDGDSITLVLVSEPITVGFSGSK
jgi:hypothetical protein